KPGDTPRPPNALAAKRQRKRAALGKQCREVLSAPGVGERLPMDLGQRIRLGRRHLLEDHPRLGQPPDHRRATAALACGLASGGLRYSGRGASEPATATAPSRSNAERSGAADRWDTRLCAPAAASRASAPEPAS